MLCNNTIKLNTMQQPTPPHDENNKPNTPTLTPHTQRTPITTEEIDNEIARCKAEAEQPVPDKTALSVQKADDSMAQSSLLPMPKMLFSEFWLEGELCILFADTNVGKSILAVQIGDSISKGRAIPGFKLEAEAQPVIYCDFELSCKQFEVRYTGPDGDRYVFGNNFYRAVENPDQDMSESGYPDFDTYLLASLEHAVTTIGARVLIIDNLTYLRNETEQARFALPLMKELKELKLKHNLSILALGHTPKRDLTKTLGRNDVMGSKMLIALCDTSFTIGESQLDRNMRYIKQVKQRSTELLYGQDNVCVCHIVKQSNFLHFEFLNFGNEREHLKEQTEKELSEFEQSVKDLMEATPGISAYAIAKKLCEDERKIKSFNIKVLRTMQRLKSAA